MTADISEIRPGGRKSEPGARLIGIIGPPAAGKTTLAENLAAGLPAELIREDYAGNPFLADSCAGRPDARLPAQLFFLLSRVRQLSLSSWPAEGLRVSDYGFLQDRIYARLRLAGDEFKAYLSVADRVEAMVKPPDLLIHLDAPEDVLLKRIARRGRAFERAMDAGFLSAVRKAYNNAVRDVACPVIRAECGRTDLRRAGALAAMMEEIRRALTATTAAGSEHERR